MANIVILINPAEYPYHTAISDMICSCLCELHHTVYTLDINSEKYDHQCLAKLNQLQPNVLITLDLAGFRFRTQAGETALNMLLTKNLNLIWGNKPEYASFLNKKVSLSMLFYDATGIDNHFIQSYPNVLYYKALGQLLCSAASETDLLTNRKHFQQIWADFIQEVLLPQA